jgi:hypothetical protein
MWAGSSVGIVTDYGLDGFAKKKKKGIRTLTKEKK